MFYFKPIFIARRWWTWWSGWWRWWWRRSFKWFQWLEWWWYDRFLHWKTSMDVGFFSIAVQKRARSMSIIFLGIMRFFIFGDILHNRRGTSLNIWCCWEKSNSFDDLWRTFINIEDLLFVEIHKKWMSI